MNPKILAVLLRAGLIAPDTQTYDAFMVWGRVIDDEEIFQRQLAATPADEVELVGVAEVLRAMSKTDLAALRERVL